MSNHCTVVYFASFFSGGFITAIVVNPPERRLTKRTSVQWVRKYEFYEMIFLHIFQDHTTLFGLFLERFSPTKQSIIGLQLSVFTIMIIKVYSLSLGFHNSCCSWTKLWSEIEEKFYQGRSIWFITEEQKSEQKHEFLMPEFMSWRTVRELVTWITEIYNWIIL